ncbi:hypothetical protein ACWDUC_12620 [Streptomyces tricolor]
MHSSWPAWRPRDWPRPCCRRARAAHRGLRHHGVVYTVGAGETPGTAFRTARMREDIRVWATSCTPTPST